MKYLLILLFALPPGFASAAGVSLDTARTDINDLKDYFAKAEAKNPQLQEAVLDSATQDAIHGVAMEVAQLYPEDFNTLLMESLEQFARNPADRPFVFKLWTTIRIYLANDFASQGFDFWHSTARGIVDYGFLLAFARSPIHWFLSRQAAKLAAAEAAALGKTPLAASRGPLLNGLTLRNEGKWLMASLGAGVTLSYIQTFLQLAKTQRIDPAPNFYVVQANLACEISRATEENSDVPTLTDWLQQIVILKTQNSDLENIEVGGERLKAKLAEAAQSSSVIPKEINCRQISLGHEVAKLARKIAQLSPKKEEDDQPTQPDKPAHPPSGEQLLAPPEVKPK